MLKHLYIRNIILIDVADIPFEIGFNVLSGETGSGKSAILAALNLVAGERADTGMIRRGSDKGSVEAVFDIAAIPSIRPILDAAGIDHDPDDDLIIRREISSNGKSRAFINNQMAQLALLKIIGEQLIEMVGQHANQRLLSLEHHRHLVDVFGSMEPDLEAFSKGWQEEINTRNELESLIASEARRLREIEVCRMELEELDEAQLKEGEEEELFAEYSLLANADELSGKTSEIMHALTNERHGALPLLNRQRSVFEYLQGLDQGLKEMAEAYQNALVELQEISYSLNHYMANIEHNPQRLADVNDRLAMLNRLKRKYGPTTADIQAYHANLKLRLDALENTDSRIDSLRAKLKSLEQDNHAQAAALTLKRKNAAESLQKAIILELRSLNMPKVDLEIHVTPQKRSKSGDDKVEFFLVPNVGEARIPIRDCASGGELSRLMLSLQTVLAGKEKIPTIIFDEIDANIGGATATVIGEKLNEIGLNHQVLCITHFPQVAQYASHHLQISKQEVEGRTLSRVQALDSRHRKSELARMQGHTMVAQKA